MKLETFFEKFEQFAEAPNAVAKMRELVLELAVRGRLIADITVAHEPRFELSADEGPCKIPASWNWVELGSITQFINGDRGKNYPSQSVRVESGVPFINAGHLINGTVSLADMDYIPEERFEILGSGKTKPGDVIYCLRGSLGKSAVASSLLILRPSERVLARFLYVYLTSLLGRRMIAKYDNGSAQPNLSATNVKRFQVPLPSLAEQMRIAAKVDELMALCDRLETQQRERDTRHAALARASLARFAEAPTPANFNLLFHPSYAIAPADLRKTILTLAVQGKLVPQDENDEPAAESLRLCGAKKTQQPVSDEEQRYIVPDSWTWIRFSEVGKQRLGKMLDAQKNRGELKPYLRNTNVQWMRFELDDVKEMRIEEPEADELRLKKGDLLICEGGEPGRCAIWYKDASEMYFQKALHRVRPCAAIISEFLALNLQVDCQNEVLARYFTGATIKHLTGRSLSEYPVPIPPLAEQRRIVAKVDQLMALVDQLEAQLAASRIAAIDLMEAVVAELTVQE